MEDQGTRIALGDELFRGDAVMPAQFYPARRGSADTEPIIRLMAGILIDAVRSYQRNLGALNQTRRKEFRESQFWIFDDKGVGPFSFHSVCDALAIDPRALREWIVRWQKGRLAGEKQRTIRRSPIKTSGQMQLRRRGTQRRSSLKAMSRD
jgi:hypothetical protein